MSVNIVEVIEDQDIILVSNGEVVGIVINRTRQFEDGSFDYNFQARTVYYPHGASENRCNFSVGMGMDLDSTKLADFPALV